MRPRGLRGAPWRASSSVLVRFRFVRVVRSVPVGIHVVADDVTFELFEELQRVAELPGKRRLEGQFLFGAGMDEGQLHRMQGLRRQTLEQTRRGSLEQRRY